MQAVRWHLEKKGDVAHLRQILLVMPFYSIESWLYQNVDGCRAACGRHCGQHHEKHAEKWFNRWEANPGSLDEMSKPKDEVCLRSKHNATLAEGLKPQLVGQLVDLKKSFHDTVELFRRCKPLTDVLKAL